MDSNDAAPLHYSFVLDIGPEEASLTLHEEVSGAILDTRRVPLTQSLFAVRVAAQDMWNNFLALDSELPLPRIRGEFHPTN